MTLPDAGASKPRSPPSPMALEISNLVARRQQLMSLHDKVRAKGRRAASSPATAVAEARDDRESDPRGGGGSRSRSSGSSVARERTLVTGDDCISFDNIEVARLQSADVDSDSIEGQVAFSAGADSKRSTGSTKPTKKPPIKSKPPKKKTLGDRGNKKARQDIPPRKQAPSLAEKGTIKPLRKPPNQKVLTDNQSSQVVDVDKRANKEKEKEGTCRSKPSSPKETQDLQAPSAAEEETTSMVTFPSKKPARHAHPASPVAEERSRRPPIRLSNTKVTHHHCPASPAADKGKRAAKKKSAKNKSGKKNATSELPKLVLTISQEDAISEMNREDALSPGTFFQQYGLDDLPDKDDVTEDVVDNGRDDVIEVKPRTCTLDTQGTPDSLPPAPERSDVPPKKLTYVGLTESTSIEHVSHSSTTLSATEVAPRHPFSFFSRMLCAACKIESTPNLDEEPLAFTDTFVEYNFDSTSYPSNGESGEMNSSQSFTDRNPPTSPSAGATTSFSMEEANSITSDGEGLPRNIVHCLSQETSFGQGETLFL